MLGPETLMFAGGEDTDILSWDPVKEEMVKPTDTAELDGAYWRPGCGSVAKAHLTGCYE